MSTKLEFTREEWNSFLKSQKCEIFSEKDVKIYMDDYKTKQETMDEFEKSCVLADLVSLNRVEVLNEDLSKSIFFIREEQTEVKKDIENFSSDLQKSKCLIYKDTPLNRLKGIVGLEVNSDVIEKARKAEPIGTEKTYGGKLYIKTVKGWRLKPKDAKSVKEDEDSKEAQAKRIDDQVRAFEEKKNLEEIKETNKKINEKIKETAKKSSLLTSVTNHSLETAKRKIEREQKNLAAYEKAISNSNGIIEAYAPDLQKIFPELEIKQVPSYRSEREYNENEFLNTAYSGEFKMKTGGSYDKALAKISILMDRLKELTKGELTVDINPFDISKGNTNRVRLSLFVNKK